jgi:hypothetical protein
MSTFAEAEEGAEGNLRMVSPELQNLGPTIPQKPFNHMPTIRTAGAHHQARLQ